MTGATEYMQRTQLLLNDESFARYNDEDILRYINMARGQIAGQSECIRVLGTITVSQSAQQYNFTGIGLVNASLSGVQGVLHVRQATYAVASGAKILHPRSFPYFNQYFLNQPVPQAGAPSVWSQYAQGALGSIFVNLLDADYVLTCDTVCYPVSLVDDSTPEAIPYEWTDAIPFFAAYFAALTLGDAARSKMMYEEYQKFVALGRGAANPSVLPQSFAQAQDPMAANRLGLQSRGQQ